MKTTDGDDESTLVRFHRSPLWLMLGAPLLAFAYWNFWTLAVLGPLVLAYAILNGREKKCEVVASRDGLRIDDRLFPAKIFKEGRVVHEGSRTFVALRGSRAIDLAVRSNVEGDEIIRALGLDASHSVATFSLRTPPAMWTRFTLLIAPVTTPLAMFIHFLPLMAVGIVLGFGGMLAMIFSARVLLRVGADGIAIERNFASSSFVSHDAIRRVTFDDGVLTIETAPGRTLHFSMPPVSNRHKDERDVELAMMVRRIEQARLAFHELATDAPPLASLLDRNERSTRDWVDALKRVGDGTNSAYRAVSSTRDELVAIVESTTSRAKERLAAIVALKKNLSDDERPRIRVAAERSAQPDTRERLIRILDADSDDELIEALEEEDRKKK